jgi:hypothetical protein
MRELILLLSFTQMAVPTLSAQRSTIKQLQQRLAACQAAKDSDATVAGQLRSMELTEQLTEPTLIQLVASFKPGPETLLALNLHADYSAFLEPPAEELPEMAPPSAAEQQSMMKSALNFVAVTLGQLPNLMATRVTRSFDDTTPRDTRSSGVPQSIHLHPAGTFTQEITYRNGRESFSHVSGDSTDHEQDKSPPGLTSWGEFGAVLAIILTDASRGKLSWSHWERTSTGLEAAFRYEVPKKASHYDVDFCCVRDPKVPSSIVANLGDTQDPSNAYHGTPGYHGFLYLDPATGAILRIALDTELRSSDPITRSAVSVQYRLVEIGGKNYICPARSVAISSTRSQFEGDLIGKTIHRINEVSFTNYHRFGSTLRIIPNPPAQ